MKMFKDAIEVFKAAVEVKQRMLWFPTFIEVAGVQVIHDHTTVLATGCRFAAVLILTDGRRVICVDDHFTKLSASTQRAVIMHEVGHVQHMHKESVAKRWMTTMMGKVSINEVEADAYAVAQVGADAMIDALTELHALMPNKEFIRRINIIKEAK